MQQLNSFSRIDAAIIMQTIEKFGSPCYLYDESFIRAKCRSLLAMPHAYGLTVRYAMKANSTRALLKIIHSEGLQIDASSLNEVRRAKAAGIPYRDVILTTQEVPTGAELAALKSMMRQGLKYNVCSLLQLQNIKEFAAAEGIALAMRVHPGKGDGESASRNTGDDYSCFGVHLSDLLKALKCAAEAGVAFDHMHVHIGSGGSPAAWRANIDLELSILEEYFPNAHTVSFGGGLKEARMPYEEAADVRELGLYAEKRVKEFYERTGRRLTVEIEPGTFIMANAGYIITEVIDKKRTGENGMQFILLNGGVEMNARPLFYGSRHPFYVVSRFGELLYSDFQESGSAGYQAVLVGRCCESGDSQCLTPEGITYPRTLSEPEVGDLVVIGGAGAYCASMAPMNYNSHCQAVEILYTDDGELIEIRRRQTLEQLLANEL